MSSQTTCAQVAPTKTASTNSANTFEREVLIYQYHAKSAELEEIQFRLAGRFSPPQREIRTREDLTFTKRDREGSLVNWHVEFGSRANYSCNGMAVGRAWFAEVIQLAKQDPREAFNALRCVYRYMAREGWGEEDGFMEEFAKAAVAGILAHPNGLPEAPELEDDDLGDNGAEADDETP